MSEERIAALEAQLKDALERLDEAEVHIYQLQVKTYIPHPSITAWEDSANYMNNECIHPKRFRVEREAAEAAVKADEEDDL